MSILSTFLVLMLGLVTLWLVWPLVADPIRARRAVRATGRPDRACDDMFRTLARHIGPDHDLPGVNRG